MKVLIVTGIYPPDIGGPAGYSKLVFEEFKKRGHDVGILVFSKYLRFPTGIRHIIFFFKVLGISRNFDVILMPDTFSAGLPVWFASFFNKKPYVMRVPGDWVWEQGFQKWGVKDLLDEFLSKKYEFKIELLKKIQSKVAMRARKIITPSQYLESVVRKWGIFAEKIEVIYNTVPKPEEFPKKDEARRKLGIKENEIILLSAGRQVPWKGYSMLHDLSPEITKQYPNSRFVIGTFPKQEFDLWLRASDIFLFNTGYEGFSHQLLEAMAHGLAIISTSSGGNAEILEADKNAIVRKYNDKEAWSKAIIHLISNEKLRKNIAINAKLSAQKFLDKDMIGETLKVLEEVIKE